MESLESRIFLIEAELERVRRQNRRIRLGMVPLAGLACLPFVLGWTGSQTGDFDLVRTRQLQIRRSDGKVMVIVGSTSGSLSPSAGGFIHVADPSGQTACEIDGYGRGGGRIRLMEAGTPNTSANTGLLQLEVEKVGTDKSQGVLKLFTENRGGESLRMVGGADAPARITLMSKERQPFVTIGAGQARDGLISVKDRNGRSEVLLEALSPTLVPGSIRGAGERGRAGAPLLRTTATTRGGGGSLTIKSPAGEVTFKAPLESKPPGVSEPR